MKKLKTIGNVLVLLFNILFILVTFVMGFILSGMSPYLLDNVDTEYIIPFAIGLEMAVIGLLVADVFMIIGIIGIKSSRYKIVYSIGIILSVVYIILELAMAITMIQALDEIDAGGTEKAMGLVSFFLTLLCVIGMLVGYLIRMAEPYLEKRKK